MVPSRRATESSAHCTRCELQSNSKFRLSSDTTEDGKAGLGPGPIAICAALTKKGGM